jgi:hypothetical protein
VGCRAFFRCPDLLITGQVSDPSLSAVFLFVVVWLGMVSGSAFAWVVVQFEFSAPMSCLSFPDDWTTRLSLAYKQDAAMPQISLSDADALLSKLLAERVPLHAYFRSPSGAEARISGFVDSKNSDGTVVISSSGPPLVADKGYLRIWIAGARTSIWYGEKRELPDNLTPLADKFGDSVLVFEISEFNEKAALFFTV